MSEREAFEKWLKYEGFDNSRMFSAIAWQGWQAARAQGGEAIAEAYVQGQIDAGINPSYSTAKAYASARKAPTSGEAVAVCDECGYAYGPTSCKCKNHIAAHPPAKVPESNRDKVVWGVYDQLCENFDFNLDPVLDIVGYLVDEGLINATPTPATTPETESADAERYRWLRDNGHLNIWWSVEGPEDRCANIDADIDEAMILPTPPQEQ